jgi:hypothetical protein
MGICVWYLFGRVYFVNMPGTKWYRVIDLVCPLVTQACVYLSRCVASLIGTLYQCLPPMKSWLPLQPVCQPPNASHAQA